MSNLNLKGVWIPIEILTDNKLSDKEKYIYAIILYLSKENNYCYLTNKSISELLNISITQVSKLVNSLKDKNYMANFEERDYTGYDFTKLYANADILIKE